MGSWNKRRNPKSITDKMGEKLLSFILCYQSRGLSVAMALRFFVWLWETTEARQVSRGRARVIGVPGVLSCNSAILVLASTSFCQTTALRPTQHRPWRSLTNESECVGPKVPLVPQVGFNKEAAWALLATAPHVLTGRTNFSFEENPKALWSVRGLCIPF